ncbi:MAG: AEC family transporter [Proteobacteria bacterium]|nr:AEC family transporter [Pseudomonadota bacterium]
MNLIYLVAPIFLVILLGKILRWILIKDDLIWHDVNKLSYWVLFPALLFNKTSVIDFNKIEFGPFSLSLVGGFTISVFIAYIIGKILRLNAASHSSVIQGSGRHNSFLALAVSTQVLGEQGELIGALAVAVLVSFSNIVTVIMMTIMLSDTKFKKMGILAELKRNPFIVAIVFGLLFNYLNLGYLPIVHDFTNNIGQAALPLALLCVGAGLHFKGFNSQFLPCMLASVLKMGVFPASVYVITTYFMLSPTMVLIAVIFAAAPTSSAGYALAKQMGGDAPLMATLISVQTLLAVLIIPIVILLLG